MLLKQLICYRLKVPVHLTLDQWEEKLCVQAFRTCGKMEERTLGWVAPIPGGKCLVHQSSDCILLAACQEERLLPAKVIQEAVTMRVDEIQETESRRVFRKERLQLKEDIRLQLLPQAFTQRKTYALYLDQQSQLLVIDASSFKVAEMLVNKLRSALGTLPVQLVKMQLEPIQVMTQWVQQASTLPSEWQLGEECELIDPIEGGGVIRCKRQALSSQEILQHIASGKLVSKLAIEWTGFLSGVLQEDLSIKRLKFSEMSELNALKEHGHVDEKMKMDTHFSLVALSMRRFLHTLFSALGGFASMPEEDRYKTLVSLKKSDIEETTYEPSH